MANPAQHQAFLYIKQTAPFHTVGFRWPTARDFPSAVRKLTVQEFMTAIELAAHAVESIKEKTISSEFEELLSSKLSSLQQKFSQEKATLEEATLSDKKFLEDSWYRKYSTLDAQAKQYESELSSAKLLISSLREQIDEIKRTTADVFQASIERATLQQSLKHDKEIERLERLLRESRESTERSSKELLAQLEARYNVDVAKLTEQLEILQKKSSDSSVRIGQFGEQAFEDIVTQYKPWKLENTSKSSHATDRSCTLRECNILFEIKNYSRDVPSEELKKFYRDMDEHNDYHLGVFISMKTDIQTRKDKGYLHIEWTKNSQMLLIFQNFLDHDPRDMLSFIDAAADTAVTMYRAHAESATSSSLNYQKRIDQAKVYIEKQLKATNDLLKQMKVDKANLSDMIDRNYTGYKYSLEQSRVSLQSCIQILMNTIDYEKEEVVEQSSETPIDTSLGTSAEGVIEVPQVQPEVEQATEPAKGKSKKGKRQPKASG